MKTKHNIRLIQAVILALFVLVTSCGNTDYPYHSTDGADYFAEGESAGYDDGYYENGQNPEVLDDFYGPDYTEGYLTGYTEGKKAWQHELAREARMDGYRLGENDAQEHFEFDDEMCHDETFTEECKQGYHDGYYETRKYLRDAKEIVQSQTTTTTVPDPIVKPIIPSSTTTPVPEYHTIPPTTAPYGMQPTG